MEIILPGNQELKILSLVEEVFRKEYTNEECPERKLRLKKKYLEIKIKIKSKINSNISEDYKKYLVSMYIEKISQNKFWIEPKNIFLL
jgi:hypothetical protein